MAKHTVKSHTETDIAKPKNSEGKIGVLGAAAIGIGGMVGGGIFAVLGTAVGVARGGTPVAFIIAGIIALLTSYSYAKLSVKFPCAGGTVVYIDRAFGIDLWTGATNLMLWLSYLVTIGLYAAAFGSYGMTFFHGATAPWLKHALISAGIILPTVINLLNADIIGKAETYIVIIKLTLLAVVVFFGAPHIDTSKLAIAQWPGPLMLVAGGMVIFVAYEGFELISNAGADVEDPTRTLPRAFYGSVIFVVILYILVAMVTVGSVPADMIAKAKDYALSEAAKPSLGQIGFTMVAVAALLATFSAINATIYGNARLGYTLAKDGELPAAMKRKVWNRPLDGVLLTAGLSLLLANFVDLTSIAIMGSAGFLIIFAVVNASGLKLAKAIGANRIICGIGLVACIIAIFALLVHSYEDNPHALWVVVSMVGVSLLFELVFPKITGRKLKL